MSESFHRLDDQQNKMVPKAVLFHLQIELNVFRQSDFHVNGQPYQAVLMSRMFLGSRTRPHEIVETFLARTT